MPKGQLDQINRLLDQSPDKVILKASKKSSRPSGKVDEEEEDLVCLGLRD